MENASKALLIAAAVLIVIILIAFGMSVLTSTTDVRDKAETTGNQLSSHANQATIAANSAFEGLTDWYGVQDGVQDDVQDGE